LVWQYTDGIEDETAIDYADKCIQLAKKITPANPWERELVQWSYNNMADLYKTAGDYETALEYIKQSAQYADTTNGIKQDLNFCELYFLTERYDSALFYWQNWRKDYEGYFFVYKAFGNTLLGKIYLKRAEYDKAIEMFNLSLNLIKLNGKFDEHFPAGPVRALIAMGEAYEGKRNYKVALSFVQQGLRFAKMANDKSSLMQAYGLISRIYHQLGRNDSAYSSILEYNRWRDSVQNKQFIWRLNNYKKAAEDAKKESQIGFLTGTTRSNTSSSDRKLLLEIL
jgi:tetratricopeptide (TPR) repeat protein